ncbi:hypothetical protein G7Y89_g1408 [Cudoniella acicularis]|uniref:2EXR domain-containing protein n=1 Tax=Cudoniella acicularis TaxID=354080 RepID=A0A8H4RXA8_9HELO|nr:hypothetical protein G7Y89_g1408 [Cudoniella acicularis]
MPHQQPDEPDAGSGPSIPRDASRFAVLTPRRIMSSLQTRSGAFFVAPSSKTSSKVLFSSIRRLGTRKCGPTTTFHAFEKLPLELRTKIWDLGLPDGRVVQMKVKLVMAKYSRHQRGIYLNSSTPVPGMLHACLESRAIALQHYELGMGSHLSHARTYVDFTKDTIYFGDDNIGQGFTLASLLRDITEKDLSKIRRLAVSQELWNYKPFCNVHVLLDFSGLKDLTLVMERANTKKGKSVALITPKAIDFQTTIFDDPDLIGEDETEIFWPDEMEEILGEHLVRVFADDHGRKMPNLKFKVLAAAASRKGKGAKKGLTK